MLLALTTDQKLGLAGTAAVFIVFSLLVALVIPRTRPDFPGRRGLVPFILVTVILTIAMLGAVEVFAKEEGHGTAAEEPAETGETTTETTGTGPSTTSETTGTDTAPSGPQPVPTTTTTEEGAAGSAEAGKAVFTTAGCGGCHAFAPAGTEGATGPDLDESLQGKDEEYVRRSIVAPDEDIAQGYSAGIMPKTYDEQLSDEQLADLVAFLRSG